MSWSGRLPARSPSPWNRTKEGSSAGAVTRGFSQLGAAEGIESAPKGRPQGSPTPAPPVLHNWGTLHCFLPSGKSMGTEQDSGVHSHTSIIIGDSLQAHKF